MRTHLALVTVLGLTWLAAACQPLPSSDPTTPADTSPVADATTAGSPSAEAPPAGEATTAATSAAETGGAPGEEVAEGPAATVNGTEISMDAFRSQAIDTQVFYVEQGLDPNSAEGQRELLRLRREVLDDMIDQALIEQAGARMGLSVSEAEVDEAIKQSVEAVGGEAKMAESMQQSNTTTEEVRDIERAGIIARKVLDKVAADVPSTAQAVHARIILCETEAPCQAALERLEAGEDFATVAAEVSADASSAKRGGDLDWVVRGMLPSREVEDALFAVPEGQRSRVVKTEFGYHIIEVLGLASDHPLTEAQLNELRQQRLRDWLAEQRKAATIVVHVEDLRQAEASN
jgi:parvulin-like peptidyl-prolyl isomerase